MNTKDVLTKEFFPLQLESYPNVVSRKNPFVLRLHTLWSPGPQVSQACLGCCVGCENLTEPTTTAGQALPS